jgi:hypothetical protein
MSSYATSSFSTPADKAYGAACWAALVESCHKTLDWTMEAEEESIDTTLPDATLTTTTSVTAGTTADTTTDTTTTREIDFLDSVYVSFDWGAEEQEAPATCPSLVSAVIPSFTSRSTKAPLGPKFALGRFMETITEESEEEEEEEMSTMDEGAELDDVSQISTEIATPPPSVSDSDRDERYKAPRNPTFEEVDALFDIVSDKRSRVMKSLGIYQGFMIRSVVIKLPDPNAKLRRISRKRDNLEILAWAASTQKYAPFTNLDLLASCC